MHLVHDIVSEFFDLGPLVGTTAAYFVVGRFNQHVRDARPTRQVQRFGVGRQVKITRWRPLTAQSFMVQQHIVANVGYQEPVLGCIVAQP